MQQQSVKHFKQWIDECFFLGVTWNDVIDKVDVDVFNGEWGYCEDPQEGFIPSIVCEGKWTPPMFKPIIDKVADNFDYHRVHTYISFAKGKTLGRHNDTMDVFIVNVLGIVKYEFDDGTEVTLEPGDGIHIPKGVYHNPSVIGPRCSLSFSKE